MKPRTIISTLRHAVTAYNEQRRYAGSLDIGLSGRGVREAMVIAAKVEAMNYDVVVTSTQRRAYETARIIVADAVPITKTPLCVERRFGVMEGLTWDEVRRVAPPVLRIRVGRDLHTVNPKGGEPLEDVWDRARKFRRFLLHRFGGRNVLVVSHGVFLQMFHGVLRGLTCIESLACYPSNMELTRFVIVGERLAAERTVRLVGAAGNRW
jgi:broad specificity phosphatase PhoE